MEAKDRRRIVTGCGQTLRQIYGWTEATVVAQAKKQLTGPAVEVLQAVIDQCEDPDQEFAPWALQYDLRFDQGKGETGRVAVSVRQDDTVLVQLYGVAGFNLADIVKAHLTPTPPHEVKFNLDRAWETAEAMEKLLGEHERDSRALVELRELELEATKAETARLQDEARALLEYTAGGALQHHFGQDARKAEAMANRWQALTVVLFAVVIVLSYFVWKEADPAKLLMRIPLVVSLAGAIGYSAKVAANYRLMQRRLSLRAIELASLEGFLEGIEDQEARDEVYKALAPSMFGGGVEGLDQPAVIESNALLKLLDRK